MKTKAVIVTAYDPQWADEFNSLSSFLKEVCGSTLVAIHHVGSTSVVGLAAKPILDVDLVIDSLADFETIKTKLATVGYRHEGDLGIQGREAFKYDHSDFMKHHLYVCTKDSSELKRHLAFIDYLRAHPEIRDKYATIKIQAAKAHPNDIDAYMAEKDHIIKAIYDVLKREQLID